MDFQSFSNKIAELDYSKLQQDAVLCRGDILTMTTLAASGHPGGSMSTIDALLTVYNVANISKNNLHDLNRDRIFISHGHISPAVYSCLARKGILPQDEYIAYFRKAGSMYEGHIERSIPGVEWTTGNLGQGLSAACGAAVAGRVCGNEFDVYVFMGDGEHEKGQITEARRFAAKYNLSNITVIVDYNTLQISGDISKVMPSMNIAASYKSDGWEVIQIDGHNFKDIAAALLKAKSCSKPVCIIAETAMGSGVSFMEHKAGFHGAPLSEEQYYEAMKELKLEPALEKYREMRKGFMWAAPHIKAENPKININQGERIIYQPDVKTDNRSAFGAALLDLVKLNKQAGNTDVVVFDCDLAGSVKTNGVEKNFPENFFQCGISEHHTAVCAGAASVNGVISFFADFGMFGVDEVYNQQRLNEINSANLKVVTTHVGIDVGEDGKTHMCIDYIGLLRNIFGFKVIAPADPNQVDAVIRYAAKESGNIHVAMGRSKIPVITKEDGSVFYDDKYTFNYGDIDIIRQGSKGAIVAYGSTLFRAVKVHEILKEKGYDFAVINAASPAYLTDDAFNKIAGYKKIFTYEDHISLTGLYSTIANMALSKKVMIDAAYFGVNEFPMSGQSDEVYDMLGLSPETVAENIIKEMGA
ncbi:MAG TPA: transketolase [Candidatus Mucispirillum faecigallinarum]|uniref:Transketolase n=1 Tax=Candidatus Mucispirillum faecigallinarum TaxID=2838699 RepID=A0A9D2GV52_9BACT|nr:transketolase [Candidatus Mucispirillum faecigallinarum]